MPVSFEEFKHSETNTECDPLWSGVFNSIMGSDKFQSFTRDRMQSNELTTLEFPPIFAQTTERPIPAGASPLDADKMGQSLSYIEEMAKGNKSEPRFVSDGIQQKLAGYQHGFMDCEGHPVQLSTDIRYQQVPNPDPNGRTPFILVPFEQQTKMNVVYTLNNGDKAIVNYDSNQTVNRRLGETAPSDSYSIIVVSSDGRQSYRYPGGAIKHVQGDGSQLKNDLNYLNQSTSNPQQPQDLPLLDIARSRS